MKFSKLALISVSGLQLLTLLLLGDVPCTAVAQDPAFELPVQLVGFPVIILSVRIANFLKRLAYSLDPNTYRRQIPTTTKRSAKRIKRKSVESDSIKDQLDAIEAEKRLIEEFGQDVCIYERICAQYALRAQRTNNRNNIDWETILSQYKKSSNRNKEFYLLSVFMGDIVASPNMCHQLAKRGRGCPGGWEQR